VTGSPGKFVACPNINGYKNKKTNVPSPFFEYRTTVYKGMLSDILWYLQSVSTNE
jgi:hypothetical protein